jgi:hypothetical protein
VVPPEEFPLPPEPLFEPEFDFPAIKGAAASEDAGELHWTVKNTIRQRKTPMITPHFLIVASTLN